MICESLIEDAVIASMYIFTGVSFSCIIFIVTLAFVIETIGLSKSMLKKAKEAFSND